MTDASARSHAITELMGRSAANLIPLWSEGTEKLAAQFAEADKFGNALSSLDTAKVENMEVSFNRLEEAVGGHRQQADCCDGSISPNGGG